MNAKIKKAKTLVAEFAGWIPSTSAILDDLENGFGGDWDTYLNSFGNVRDEAGYLDDSWGDYETGNFR